MERMFMDLHDYIMKGQYENAGVLLGQIMTERFDDKYSGEFAAACEELVEGFQGEVA